MSAPFRVDAAARSPGSSNFGSLLWQAGRSYGQQPAMIERGRITSFGQIAERAAGIAEALTKLGVRPGDRVAVLLARGEDAAAAFFGVLAAGAVGINLNELYRPRQIEYVLRHAGARVLLTSAGILKTHPRPIESAATIVDVDSLPRTGTAVPVEVEPGAMAQITYTSGSTGQPKGVMMSHANLWAGVRIVAGYLGITATDRIASLLPFSFVYGFNQLTCSLFTGAALVIERSTLAQEIVSALKREQVTVVAGVPPLWLQLLRVPAFRDAKLEQLRVLTNAGGRLPPATVAELRTRQPHARLFLMYGLTEVFRSAYLSPDEVDAHPDSMGRAIPESRIYVVSDTGTPCEPGEVGELVHGGPTVGLGYLNDPESTARTFRDNPFRGDDPGAPARVVFSGDLVRRDTEGRLYYVGRRDRMFKTLGYRVSPDEICDVLYASGQVSEGAVLTEPDEQRGERVVAFVVLRDGGSLEALRIFCANELPRYMQPARFEIRSELPRNMSGKHDLLTLRRDLEERSAAKV